MKRLLIVVLLFLSAVAFSPILIGEKGYILIAMGDLTIKSTVVTASIMLILSFIALLMVLKFFRGGLNFSFAAWNKIAFANRRKALRDLNKGIAAYVLGDYTAKLSPQGWASKAIQLYHQYEADRIVAEVNQGGDMVKTTIHGEDETVSYKAVRASRGKYARAEPISALYERGLVKHVSNPPDGASLNELETQMRTWEPLGRIGSPDRLDAMVWALTDLCLNGWSKPQLTLAYSSAKGLSK